jgi:hypothetical protein
MTFSFFEREEETRGKLHRSSMRSCAACKLHLTSRKSKCKEMGIGENGIMFVGRSPNEQYPWMFDDHDLVVDQGIYMWSIACNPSRGKYPLPKEIA